MTEATQILSIIPLSLPKLFGLSHLLIPKTKITKKEPSRLHILRLLNPQLNLLSGLGDQRNRLKPSERLELKVKILNKRKAYHTCELVKLVVSSFLDGGELGHEEVQLAYDLGD
jgi:hypothetical protein